MASRVEAPDKKLLVKSIVVLKSDPSRQGRVLQVSRDGRTASVQFDNYPRPTMHAAEGLIVVSQSTQMTLFDDR